jgi:hypothetical protein
MTIIYILGCLAALCLYFLPAFLAQGQHKHADVIFWVNFLAGWTIIGWFVCFIWAATSRTQKVTHVTPNPLLKPYTPPAGSDTGYRGRLRVVKS